MEGVVYRACGREFRCLLTGSELEARVRALGEEVVSYYEDLPVGKPLDVVVILRGAFMFASDLVRAFPRELDVRLHFVQYASYACTMSTGKVTAVMGLQGDWEDREVLLVEDIVDSGQTIRYLVDELLDSGASRVRVVSFLLREGSAGTPLVDCYGYQIGEGFVVGYGMDIDGHGRHLADLYIEAGAGQA